MIGHITIHHCDLISAVFCFTEFVSVSRFHLDQTRSGEIKHCAPKEALGIEIRWKNCHPAMLLSSQSATEGTNMGDVGRCFGNVFLVVVFFQHFQYIIYIYNIIYIYIHIYIYIYWIGWSSSTYQNGSVVAFFSGLLFQVHLPATHVDDEWHEQRTCGPSPLVRPSWSADAFSRRWLTTNCLAFCVGHSQKFRIVSKIPLAARVKCPNKHQQIIQNPAPFFRYVCIIMYICI